MIYLFTLTWSAAVMAALVSVGLLGKSRPWLASLEKGLGLAGLGLWLFKVAWFAIPSWNREPYIPLHLCNFAEIVCYLSLLTRWKKLQPLVYFWSLGALQAFVSPIVREGPATLEYWLFWLPHAMIVGTAIYQVVVHNYRPNWKDVLFALAATLLYSLIVLPYNLIFDTNYGFVGRGKPDVPTLIDYLGTWPLRLLWLATIVIGVFVIAWLPWEFTKLHKSELTTIEKD